MVRVAVVGCAHGMLDDIYATVKFINEMDEARPVQLLLCCGDFECMRNERDLQALACPPKYREMHSFHAYYKGEKTAPVLTIFVGGNHEASNYLQELHYGGWVAPNIFYLGAAGVVNVGGLRIGGLSGIYKHQDYTSGRFERAPFDNSTMRSVYHVRELEVYQLSHVQQREKDKLNVFLSHDWPRGIEQFGDLQTLLRRKPFFQQEIQSNTLGSPAGEFLLYQLKPEYWFAAHLHVKFAAIVRHEGEGGSKAASGEEHKSEDSVATSEAVDAAGKHSGTTKFLALDKCLPRREFLQVLDIPGTAEGGHEEASGSLKIMFDPEWLAILRATHHLASTNKYGPRVPQEEMAIEARDVEWIKQRLHEFWKEKQIEHKVEGEWVSDFVKTVPAYGEPAAPVGQITPGNPQTDLLLELLKLPHIVTAPFAGAAATVDDPNEIDLDDDVESDTAEDKPAANNQEVDESGAGTSGVAAMQIQEQHVEMSLDPSEIELDADPPLRSAFVELDCDAETQDFLDSCTGGGVFESVASTVLGMFYSLTDANGILGRGQMFVLSQTQIQRLLHRGERVGGSLLDIGAGDGNVTKALASLVDKVITTEVSAPMAKSLNARGYNCVETSELDHPLVQQHRPYNIISLMNVLDRADKPMTMLRQIRDMLDPTNGLFLLAVVLPFAAFVEVGTRRMDPTEKLPMRGGLCAHGASFEAAANVLLRNVLQPAGFKLRQFSRVPYLCRGDLREPYYVLSDAVFVLEVDQAHPAASLAPPQL